MSRVRLSKHHGLGNDFLVYLDLDERRPLTAELARALCDRHLGVGADGLIRLGPGREGADVSFELRNSDGSPAEMSGNGMRCLAQAAVDAGVAAGPSLEVSTVAGVRAVRIGHETAPGLREASVDMGPAKVEDRADASGTRSAEVMIGNPHLVMIDEGGLDLKALGTGHPGHNVELITVVDRGRIDMRVWERGAGLTEACGTGSCAAAAAAAGWGMVDSRVVVRNPGGDVVVEVGETITLTGPTQWVADVDVEVP